MRQAMLRSAIVTKNLALLEAALQQACDLPHTGYVVDLGEEVRKQLVFELETAKLAAKGQAEGGAASARMEARLLDREKFSARVKQGVHLEHHATAREQRTQARKKSMVSTSACVLAGEAVAIEGERNIRNVAGGYLVRKGEQNPAIERRILTMMNEAEVFEDPLDDEMVRLMVLLLKRELPSLITKYTNDDKLAFQEFCRTFNLSVCPIFRDAEHPKCTEAPAKKSLTFLEESLEKHCLVLFQGLLSFMGIRHEAFPETLIEEMVITGECPHTLHLLWMWARRQSLLGCRDARACDSRRAVLDDHAAALRQHNLSPECP